MDTNIFNINDEIQQFRNTNFEIEKQNQNILSYISVNEPRSKSRNERLIIVQSPAIPRNPLNAGPSFSENIA